MGGLHLPHWKVEALASCTPKANVHLCDLVYWKYLNGSSALGDVPVHNGINGRITQTHLLNVEGLGTQNGSRVELPGDLLCMATWPWKSKGYGLHRLLYRGNLVNDVCWCNLCPYTYVAVNRFAKGTLWGRSTRQEPLLGD